MARTPITVTTTAAPAPQAGDPVNGNSVANPDGKTCLLVANTGAVTRTLGVRVFATVDGLAVAPRTISIPAGQTWAVGNYPTLAYGTTLLLDPEHAELTFVALRIGESRTTVGAGASSTYNYTASTTSITNPSRGFFQYTETHYTSGNTGYVPLNSATLSTARTSLNRSLVFRYFVMEKFLTQDTIDPAWLTLLTTDLAAVRTAGCKIIPRFVYSTSGTTTPPYQADPPVNRVLGHITQLAPTLNTNADIVDSIETGMIGMWGEWYYTDNFGDTGTVTTQQYADRLRVVAAWLDLLDTRIPVLVRYPGLKHRWFG